MVPIGMEAGEERRAIGVVFQALDLRRDVMLGALEIDLAVGLLVAAADMPRGDAPEVIAPAGLGLALGKHLDGRALPQAAAIDQHQLAQAWSGGTEGLECHGRFSLTGPSSRRWNGPLRGSPPRA
jgi:hypothetical protein